MFEVAHALGIWNVPKMLEEMNLDLLMYWIAYLSKRKCVHTKTDYGLASIAKAVTEKDVKGANRPITDYLITFETEEDRKKKEEDQQERYFYYLANLPGATVTK